MTKVITLITILCFTLLSTTIVVGNDKPSTNQRKVAIIVKKKKDLSKNSNMVRIPAASKVLDCTISNGTIIFHPSFWGDGMSVRIISENGVEWTGFVSESNASMTFDGQIGLYNIECKLVNGSIYFGQFYMQTYI